MSKKFSGVPQARTKQVSNMSKEVIYIKMILSWI